MEDRKHPDTTPRTGENRRTATDEVDLANDKMGNNQLQGNDQSNVRNQRHAAPDVKDEADGVIESFKKIDKDVRARKDLGKFENESD